MKPGAAVRATAARIIAAVMRGETLDRALESQIDKLPLRDQPLCREICFGTLRQYPRLDALLRQLLAKPIRAKDSDVKALALAGLYQLSAMRIPAHAAVSATVDAAMLLRKRQTAGLLNAVLRRFQREETTLVAALSGAEAAAHPLWLWESLGQHWPAQREQIVRANNSHPPMTLRVNLARIDRSSYLALLEKADITAVPGSISEAALTLEQPVDVSALPGFADGLCSVQDEGAQMAAGLLAPRPGERILDACAAPGGKSCHILEQQRLPGSLTAMDISAERLLRVQENLDRLGLQAKLVVGDGARPPKTLTDEAPFDAILLDVPCSASGVIRRHPDIKLLRRADDGEGFAQQQRALLTGLWPLLAQGGRLLYVTCSILPEENSDVIAAFLENQKDAREESVIIHDAQPCKHGQQLLPSPFGSDGLYYALLRKTG